MPGQLQTLVCAFLPPTRGIRLMAVSVEEASVRLQLTTTVPTAACPGCAVLSSSVHSRYQRRLTDLPWGVRAVRLQLTVRKFRCRNRACGRRISTECVPDLVEAYARHSPRVATVLRAIGLALGGKAGARLAARLQLSTSPATVLRLVRGRRSRPPQPCRPSGSTSGRVARGTRGWREEDTPWSPPCLRQLPVVC